MQSFTNPIVPGFAPDPSVVLVDDTFYLVNSSFHLFPGLPIYASKDLVKWVHIGNAINNPDYLNLGAALTARVEPPGKPEFYATAGLLAPTIRFHQGRFYIVCTNASISPKGYSVQNFYISTDDIWSGQWSKPVLFDFAGIDTSLFIDDDGRAYIQGSWSLGLGKQPSSTIKQIEIDLETGKALSEPKEIWPGFAREDAEGPHVYRKDGYYYLVIAEGGTFEHHMVTAARATNIWGPYEAYNMNPLTTADGTGRYIQNTGHTDLFQDASGAWWAVLLGVRNDDKRHPMGRETFLVPVSWPEGEWPVFEPAELQFEREPALQKVSSSEINFIENDGLVHIRYPSQDRYERLETEGSFKSFKIKTSGHKLSSRAGPISFVGKRQRSQTCRATTELQVDANNASKPVTASLAVFKDELRHAAIGFDHATSTIVYESVIGETHSLAKKQLSPSPYRLILGIDCTVDSFDFFYGLSGEDTHSLGSLDSLELSSNDFTGTIIGLHAHSSGDQEDASFVTFVKFTIQEKAMEGGVDGTSFKSQASL